MKSTATACYSVESKGRMMFSELNSGCATYIIAEVGQNHQGYADRAIEYVETFSKLGADAVKFQIRNNEVLFDKTVYDQPYTSTNSFGETYGEHRNALELSHEDFYRIRKACDHSKSDLIVTPFDQQSLSLTLKLGVDAIKVASFDLGNLAFLRDIAKSKKPVVLSTGGGNKEQIAASVNQIFIEHDDLALLHCVSHYPCPAESVRLGEISNLRLEYEKVTIGLSDHFSGILTGPLGYLLGARVFEKHVTFNRADKGTDHPFSLEPDGFRKFVRDIKRTKVMTTYSVPDDLGMEPVFNKLGKSIVSSRMIPEGKQIDLDDLDSKIYQPQIIPVRETYRLLGKHAVRDVKAGVALDWDMIGE